MRKSFDGKTIFFVDNFAAVWEDVCAHLKTVFLYSVFGNPLRGDRDRDFYRGMDS